MRNQLRDIVKGTPFEPLARWLWYLAFPSARAAYIDRRELNNVQQAIRVVLGRGGVGIDIGAHTGDTLWPMFEAAPDTAHIGFEPIPWLAEDLRRRFPRAVIHQKALATEPGTATFNVARELPGYSGLKANTYPEGVTVESIRVEIERLDTMVPAETPVALIKIDVEGAELDVLRGGERLLARHRPVVVFEHAEKSARFYGCTPEAMADLFSRTCGHRIWTLAAWLAGRAPLDARGFRRHFESGDENNFVAAGGPPESLKASGPGA
ncbi:MAG: FkbM family methyltransferase [Phycisphaerales bacterium]|nr:FkbM family methyltransferase [Phycisphaerales bacterium]